MPQRKQSITAGISIFLILLFVVSALLALAGLPLDLKTQLVFSAFIFSVCLLLSQFNNERAKFMLIVLTLLVSTRYIWWRASSTLAFDDSFSALAGYTLFAAEIYAYIVLLLGYVQTIRPLRRKPVVLPENESSWPTVDVFIPTYNEPLNVVAATIAGAMNLEYPANKLNIYVLDDGNRPEFKRYALEAGVHYRARTSNEGAKAGNINEAFKYTGGELVAIFDCDQIPVRSFLQVSVGWFLKDHKMAQVQLPHYFYTPDPIEKNLSIESSVPNESSLFYGLIQDGNDLWNATFFCGSCAILRRTAINEIGGVAEETVTEDAHTSLKLHRKGFNSAYLNEVQSAGLATESLSGHINQRIRWARGLAQIFRLDNPFFGKGLSIGQRLCYANATMHFFYAVPRLVFLIAPLFFLLFDLSIIQSEATMVAAMALPHILQSNLASTKISGHWRHAFWAEVYETVLSFYIFMPTLIALITPSRGKFNVTEKGNVNESSYYAYSLASPILLLGLLNVAAIFMGLNNLYLQPQINTNTTVLNLVWATYNFVIIGVALGVAWEIKQSRLSTRHKVSLPAVLTTSTGRQVRAMIQNMSTTGACVIVDNEYQRSAASQSDSSFSKISFDSGRGMVAFDIEYVTNHSSELRLRFIDCGFDQLRHLVRVLYSPADRWQGIREEFKEAGMIRCLFTILVKGIIGWGYAVTGMFSALHDLTKPRNQRLLQQGLTATGAIVLVVVSLFLFITPSISEANNTQTDMSYEIRDLTDKTEKTIELGTVSYGSKIPFAIRRDTVVNSGELAINISWSDKSEESERFLRLLLNDTVMWTASTESGDEVDLRLPFDGVRLSDYNSLSFELEYINDSDCAVSSNDSFELVIHDSSRIKMDVTSIPIANDLETLPLPFFDERDPRRLVINFVVPSDPTSPTVLAAGRTAAWFGALASYRGVEFQVTQNTLPDNNAIVVATGEELPLELKWLDAGEPRVLLVDNPLGDNHQLLVLTAPDDDGLLKAVDILLASVNSDNLTSYLKQSSTSAYPDRVIANRWVDTSTPLLLGSLVGDDSLEIKDNNFSPISIPFEVPGDFHPGVGKSHQLTLDYHYGPDFPDFDEQMYISLNGFELRSINLGQSLVERLFTDDTSYGEFEGKIVVDVPHELIRPNNTLDIRFTAPDEITSNCHSAAVAQVSAGIDGRSTLDLSNGIMRGRYPDLALFVNSGLPFTQYADLRQTHIELPQNPQSFHYALYLNIMGRFAAITGTEPDKVSVARGKSLNDRVNNILIVNKNNFLRVNSALAKSPLTLTRRGIQVNFDSWHHLYIAISDWVNPFAAEKHLSRLTRSAESRDAGYLLGTKSATSDGGTTLVFVADTQDSATALQLTLTDPLRLSEVRGSAVVADLGHSHSVQTGRAYTSGSFTTLHAAKWWLSENLLVIVVLVCSLAFISAIALTVALDRVAFRRLQ